MNKPILNPGAIIFDFGGTLDTNGVHWSEKYWDGYCAAGVAVIKPLYEKAYVAAGDKMLEGLIDSSFSFRQTIETQVGIQLHHLIEKNNIDQQKYNDHLCAIVEFCYQDVVHTINLIKPMLSQLHEKYDMAVVSNFYGNIDQVLQEFGIRQYFDVVIDSAVVGIRKPDPAIFKLGVDRLNKKPEEVLVIGDSYERDIIPAAKTGCLTGWLKGRSWTELPSGDLATITMNNLQELKTILDL